MSANEAKSLAGERARIQLTPADTGFVVTFGPDVKLEWVNGGRLGQQEEPNAQPQITGNLETEEDHSAIQDAELILDDQSVYKISFQGPTRFFARQSINSRNQVY